MNGADMACDALLGNGVDTWFANPGTSEMHLVAALDRKPEIRCILGLEEGVVSGAADGYARMKEKPAATLLHCGPGLANGLANLHNARRARTPVINIVGDHASYHLAFDAPLTSDIESLARPMSHWVGRVGHADEVSDRIGEAYSAAMTAPGVATLIIPADAAWTETAERTVVPQILPVRTFSDASVAAAVSALRSDANVMLLLSGDALRGEALASAAAICGATGARMAAAVANGRIERGASRPVIHPIPYPVDLAVAVLRDVNILICVGPQAPPAFFAYPGKPSRLVPEHCKVLQLASFEDDLKGVLRAVADGVRARPVPYGRNLCRPNSPVAGRLTGAALAAIVARHLPDGAIVCEEAITSAREFFALSMDGPAHDYLALTGGAIGAGIPLAIGAAVACPGRKIIGLQADGSGMYTVQGLWTQARERLDIVTVILANHTYAVLHGEMRNVGVGEPGKNARRMLDLDDPALDWVSIARGMGVAAERADTVERFDAIFAAAVKRSGPFLIEAVI